MYRLVTPSSGLILQLDEIKNHLRVDADVTDYDELLDGYRLAAEQQTRQVVGMPLLPETWQATFAAPDRLGRLILERGPHLSISKVEIMSAGVYVTQDAATWTTRGLDVLTSFVKPAPQSGGAAGVWPKADMDEEAFRVTFQAGFADAASIPQPIRAAMLLMIGGLFANRSSLIPANLVVNPAVQALLGPYRAQPV